MHENATVIEAERERSLSPSDSGSLWVPGRPAVDGKYLRVGEDRFWVKAVTYGSFAPNDDGEPFPPLPQLRDDFARMRDAGINTVRLYGPPSDRIADAAADVGLFLIPDICWGMRRCELDDPNLVRFTFDWTRGHAKRLADHPAMLMFSIGNEIPPLMVRWYGRKRIESFVHDLYQTVKEQAPHSLVTYCNHPPTEYVNLPFLDVVSYNIYLERETDFRKYLARLQTLAGNRPLFISELGLDSRKHGTEKQAEVLDWQLRAVFEKGLCGAAVYAWTDQWSIFQHAIEGWDFGLTDADRWPKPALATVRRIYCGSLYQMRKTPWPRVSVVVAVYNGAKTLDNCLRSLRRLNYPDYEIIVIDDGSKDHTPQIVTRHGVRSIRVDNGGLSRARNLGIEAATGSIVAFIDSDAYADEDWLFNLVTTLEEHNAAGVGGPNLTPPEDGFVALCVDHAPGNPTHVLLDDETAEHVPGCNMAFRKDALQRINMFDPTHRAAGDDVDVCWKLLVREEKIAFSPSAVVWHHRRPTVKGFLKQQRGYGYAEAHLKRRYPGRFNVFGDLVWRGAVYDSPQTAMRAHGVPLLFKPVVYQGLFGGGMFQSIYQPFLNWWFQIFTTAEWQMLSWCVLAAGVLGLMMSPLSGAILLSLATAMIATTVGVAMIPASHAVKTHRWRGLQRAKGFLLVTTMHILQPLVRAAGYLRGLWDTRGAPDPTPPVERVWGNLAQRQEWLDRLQDHLRACGWICKPSEPWSETDIDVEGPGPCRVTLCSTYEENLEKGRHYVRFRVEAKRKRILPLLWTMLTLALPLFVLFPFLLPLALPWAFAVKRLADARRFMIAAVAQLASECAEGLNMPKVENP
ncbi:MAG: glycosyltransferase [Phycisphaeraceae bacterium]